MGYLLDTNAVINYLDGSLPESGKKMLDEIVDEDATVSVITKIETLGYNFKSFAEQNLIETFIEGSTILDLTDEIVNQTIAIRKTKKIKLPDTILAATALVYDLILISWNTSDFKNIQGLKVIDPHLI